MARRRRSLGKTAAFTGLGIFGVLLMAVIWIVSVAASLAVPALAVWALLHFAFHVV